MSLGHVYIVLEPVGSARLTFNDDRYYEFMCFDVPKVVRRPRCDHGHDEESQNGRDIKIDILEAYVWTSEWLRVSSGKYRSTGELPELPGECMGLNGPKWERGGGGQVEGTPPQAQSKLGGGAGPTFLLPLSSFLPLLIQLGKRGV